MGRTTKLRLDVGEMSAAAPSDVGGNGLITSSGIGYRINDGRAWLVKGRELLGNPDLAALRGLSLIKFDDGTLRLMTLAGTALRSIDPDDFSVAELLDSSKSPGSIRMSVAAMNDRWFVVTGFDHNTVVAQDADGNIDSYLMGLDSPQEAPDVTISSDTGNEWYTDVEVSNTGGWINFAKIGDDDTVNPGTFGGATLEDDGIEVLEIGWTDTTTGADRIALIRWRLAGLQSDSFDGSPGPGGSGPRPPINPGYRATILIEKSEDSGANYTTMLSRQIGDGLPPMTNWENFRSPITASAANNVVRFRLTLRYNSGTSPATFRVQLARINQGSQYPAIDGGGDVVRYCYTEFDQTTGTEGPPSGSTEVAFDGENRADIVFPATPQNGNRATHRYIYRTPPIKPDDPGLSVFGRIAIQAIDETTFVDVFDVFGYEEQAFPLLEMIAVGELYFPANQPPPQLDYITEFDGSLVGIRGRQLYRSLSGRPESWPEILAVDSIPIPDNDNLVAGVQVGNAFAIFAKESSFAIDEHVRSSGRALIQPKVRRIANVGCAGIDLVSVIDQGGDGEELAAWVSPFGIHMTNGFTSRTITDDILWSAKVPNPSLLSGAVLRWDRGIRALRFYYPSSASSTGNDRYALLFMSPQHQTERGLPKTTWGHVANLSVVATGIDLNQERVWSGDYDGNVFLEDGYKDEQTGGDIPFSFSYHLEGDWRLAQLLRGRIRHTSGEGVGVTVTIVATMGRGSQTVVRDVVLESGPTEFFIGRGGDRFDITISGFADREFGIESIELDTEQGDLTGASVLARGGV